MDALIPRRKRHGNDAIPQALWAWAVAPQISWERKLILTAPS
jgi:hypothetical protein